MWSASPGSENDCISTELRLRSENGDQDDMCLMNEVERVGISAYIYRVPLNNIQQLGVVCGILCGSQENICEIQTERL